MSNFFALLNDSDDDEPKVVQKKVAAPKNPKAKALGAPAAVVAPVVLEPSKKGKQNDKYDKRDSNTRANKSYGDKQTADGKRQFERKSGTGRGKEVAKGGNGSRNWGSDKQEAEKAEGQPAAEGEEAVVAEAVEEVVVVEEEPDNTMTYDQFMAAKREAKAASATFAALQIKEVVNEFAAAPAKGATAQQLEDFLVMGEGKKLRKKGGEEKAVKQTLEVAFKVKDSTVFTESDGDSRGGRGGGRGAGRGGRGDRPERPPRAEGEARPERRERTEGGRGGGRGGRGENRGPRPARGEGGKPRGGPVNVLDASSFPSLS